MHFEPSRRLTYKFDEIWPTLVLSSEDGKRTVKVTVSQDPEGNGPGYLFVEEVKS